MEIDDVIERNTKIKDLFVLMNDKNKHDEALKLCKKLYKKYPNNVTIKYSYGILLMRDIKTFDRGKQLIEKVFPYLRNKGEALFILAKNHYKYGYIEEAIEYCNKSIALKKTDAKLKLLCDLYISKKEYEKALYLLEKLIETQYSSEALKSLLYMYIVMGNYQKALEVFEKVLEYEDLISDVERNRIRFFLKYKLNLLTNNYKSANYFEKQVLKYSFEDAISHVKQSHKSGLNMNDKSMFLDEIDVSGLYDICYIGIQNIQPIEQDLVDKYILEFNNNIGIDKNIQTNLIEIVTVSNTKDILTFYPVVNEKYREKSHQKIKKK